jgi:hypothetical protein
MKLTIKKRNVLIVYDNVESFRSNSVKIIIFFNDSTEYSAVKIDGKISFTIDTNH